MSAEESRKVVSRAVIDEEFRNTLFSNPDKALEGYDLTPEEVSALRSIPAETIDDDYPVWLTTGRRLESYHSRTQTGRSEGIDYLLPEELLEVHPEDLAAWGVEDGSWVEMSSRRGSVTIKVQATERSPRGTVFSSFSFNDVPVNILTGAGYDPVTDTAELKVCPVRIRPSPGRGDVAAD